MVSPSNRCTCRCLCNHPAAARNRELPIANRPKLSFAKRIRTAHPYDRYQIHDDAVTRLCLRVSPGRARTFVLSCMVRGRGRYVTVGSAGAMTVPEAHAKARRLTATFTDMAKTDGAPRTPGHPMTAFVGVFLDRQARHWKLRTLQTNTYLVRNVILPAFGQLTADAIAVEHVRDRFAVMADRPGIANRAMPMLSTMMRMA